MPEPMKMPDIVLNLDDPVTELFALQFDFRERFMQALRDILAVPVEGRSYKAAVEAMRAVATEALDPESIATWIQEGRPIPWLDELYVEPLDALEEFVRNTEDLLYEPLMRNP